MRKATKAVGGIHAPSAKPTILGAAVVAALITFPVSVTILLVDLILL